jgi:hypothetical protein
VCGTIDQRRSKIRAVVEQFRFVDRKPGSGKSANNGSGKRNTSAKTNRRAQPALASAGAGTDAPF